MLQIAICASITSMACHAKNLRATMDKNQVNLTIYICSLVSSFFEFLTIHVHNATVNGLNGFKPNVFAPDTTYCLSGNRFKNKPESMKFAISFRNRVFFVTNKLVPALFLHTQKTAGTTLITLARRFYKNDMITHGDYLALPSATLSKIAFISGHFGYEYASQFMESRYSFTFLRNPVDRILSFYYFCRSQNPDEYPIYRLSQQMELEEFMYAGLENPLVRSYIWNQQTWQLACGSGNLNGISMDEFNETQLVTKALDHLHNFTHIGFTETFEQDRDVIFGALGLPLPRGNWVENHSGPRRYRHELPQATLKIAAELTRLDQELYSAAWARRRRED